MAWAGDGGTADIGLQALSGAAERGDNFLFICYDNEGYMNTGVQRSGTTPQWAITCKHPHQGKAPAEKGCALPSWRPITSPMWPPAPASYPLDLYDKVSKARDASRSQIHPHPDPLPSGLGLRHRAMPSKLGKLAVETGLFELYEVEHRMSEAHRCIHGRSADKRALVPVAEFFKAQSRFRLMDCIPDRRDPGADQQAVGRRLRDRPRRYGRILAQRKLQVRPVEVAARHDEHHLLALEPLLDLHGSHERGCTGAFGEVVRGGERQADAFEHLVLARAGQPL
ncbi:MAG: thiamine pyrophosphate-dependent enzyme [Desulfosudis oleivorans]|nr:thiamine pyrophosphate-dependent enzyme [Desulfosudis oleivorans]